MENRVNISKDASANNLPAVVSVWTKVRNFLCKEINLELTPKQEKVFREVHDFWNQEITGEKVHDFLFYEITGEKVKNFLFQDIKIVDNIKL